MYAVVLTPFCSVVILHAFTVIKKKCWCNGNIYIMHMLLQCMKSEWSTSVSKNCLSSPCNVCVFQVLGNKWKHGLLVYNPYPYSPGHNGNRHKYKGYKVNLSVWTIMCELCDHKQPCDLQGAGQSVHHSRLHITSSFQIKTKMTKIIITK